MCSICDFMDCYTFLEWSHYSFLRGEPWGGRVSVTYATCMTVSDLMWRLLFNAHSFIQNNKLCTLKAYRLSELNFFVYIKSCQYSMFYTNKMF